MKSLKFIALMAIVSFMLSSCESTDDNKEITLILNATEISYDENGLWTEAMNPGAKIVSQGFGFSHSVNVEWNFWNGFAASRSKDNANYSPTNEWLLHQTTAMPAGGLSGEGTPYMIGYWNSIETTESAERSCKITFGDNVSFTPKSMYVSNTSYVYYTIKDGNAFSRKFDKGDYFILKVYGMNGTTTVGPVNVYLADYRSENQAEWVLLKDWNLVSLESLGKVDSIFFTLESSDSGQWGINTPTYFALDRLKITL